MIFYPKKYINCITDISKELLTENNIQAVLIDIDNTILDKENNTVEGLENWIKTLKNDGIKFCILSNTNSKKKAEKLSKNLEIPYIYFAKKPLKFGFKRAQKMLKIENEANIAVVGDQVLTDVLGANRCNMYSILVKPLKTSDIFITKFNRKIERIILKRYFKENNTKQK